MYERLYTAFTNYWTHRGFKLHDPELPLVVLVFPDQSSYAKQGRAELGDAATSIIGYYSLKTNRVTMYDLTGVDALRRAGDRRGSAAQINQMLARPEAEAMVATIVHEATHQIAFNCGLQVRFADVPLWVSEGIAVYFETPDLSSAQGLAGIGEVNRPRLERFREYLAKSARQVATVADGTTAASAIRGRPRCLRRSLGADLFSDPPEAEGVYGLDDAMSAKQALLTIKPEERIAEFKAAMGEDLDRLDAEFVKFMHAAAVNSIAKICGSLLSHASCSISIRAPVFSKGVIRHS